MGMARREAASRDRGWRAFGVDVPMRWGRVEGRKRLGGCGGAHVKYGGYSKKSGKANAPAILAAPSSCGSASGCVTKKSLAWKNG